jgi:outer membrane biosynthesis protein TonB
MRTSALVLTLSVSSALSACGLDRSEVTPRPVGEVADEVSPAEAAQAESIATDLPAEASPERGTPALDEAIVVAGDVIPPVRLHTPEPKWSQVVDCRWPGAIIVQSTIDKEGNMGDIVFLGEQPPDCIQAPMREALKKWRFKPAELRGQAVKVYYNLTVNINWQ